MLAISRALKKSFNRLLKRVLVAWEFLQRIRLSYHWYLLSLSVRAYRDKVHFKRTLKPCENKAIAGALKSK